MPQRRSAGHGVRWKLDEGQREKIENLLRTTDFSNARIAGMIGGNVKPEDVRRHDHDYGVRPHETAERIRMEREEELAKAKAQRFELARRARQVAQMDAELKTKIISENIGLFHGAITYYYWQTLRGFRGLKRGWIKRYFRATLISIFRKHKIKPEDLFSEFIIYCSERLEWFDPKRAKFSTFVYRLAQGFVTEYARKIERQERTRATKPAPAIRERKMPLKPRGWKNIPTNLRSIAKQLGLPLEIFIRFGQEESKVALQTIARESGLKSRQDTIMTMLIEGLTQREIGQKLGINFRTVSMHANQALQLMKEHIKNQRASK